MRNRAFGGRLSADGGWLSVLGSQFSVIGVCVVALAGAVTAGCQRETPIEPPTIHYGQDICAECGMIVSDSRFAAAMLIEQGGRREMLLFDDIGCLIVGQWQDESLMLARWVTDASSGQWLDATRAAYLFSPDIITPMAFGAAAYADRAAAEQAALVTPGVHMDFATLVARLRKEPPSASDHE
ncbi:MAG: nitrous oxide reductase accessory protein NosL [Phycisphaeraceae bacterium]|nr:nitrous oxide reductase accessory protein NosL [Phycisphaerales bacterium]QOJ17637.1 MAG: nitrous oxide reductase accessory protein NosL [Phycisphaeraceae bacterium]